MLAYAGAGLLGGRKTHAAWCMWHKRFVALQMTGLGRKLLLAFQVFSSVKTYIREKSVLSMPGNSIPGRCAVQRASAWGSCVVLPPDSAHCPAAGGMQWEQHHTTTLTPSSCGFVTIMMANTLQVAKAGKISQVWRGLNEPALAPHTQQLPQVQPSSRRNATANAAKPATRTGAQGMCLKPGRPMAHCHHGHKVSKATGEACAVIAQYHSFCEVRISMAPALPALQSAAPQGEARKPPAARDGGFGPGLRVKMLQALASRRRAPWP